VFRFLAEFRFFSSPKYTHHLWCLPSHVFSGCHEYFPLIWSGRGVKLITHLRLVLSLRKSVALPPHSPAPSWRAGKTLYFFHAYYHYPIICTLLSNSFVIFHFLYIITSNEVIVLLTLFSYLCLIINTHILIFITPQNFYTRFVLFSYSWTLIITQPLGNTNCSLHSPVFFKVLMVCVWDVSSPNTGGVFLFEI